MIVRFIRAIDKMTNRDYQYRCLGCVFKNFFFVINVAERGIPFCENWGFPE